jgi:hypothetical protein
MTTPKEAIKEILDTLDITEDTNWTDDGMPALDVIQALANDETITRGQVNDASPGFVRQVGEAKTAPIAPVVKVVPEYVVDNEFTDDQMRGILDRRVNDAQDALIAAQKRQSEATQEVTRCQARLARAHSDRGRRFPPITAAQNIKAHLEAQGREAMKRHGLDPDTTAAIGRWPIEAAMARSNRRGAGEGRPTRPIMAGRLMTKTTAAA